MPTDRFNRLILRVNKLTEVNILPTDDGCTYYWEWRCVTSEAFDTEELALIDWIQKICKDYEDLLIESLDEDEKVDDEDGDDEDEKDLSFVDSNGQRWNGRGSPIASIP